MITIYSKPSCVQCVATTREMDRRQIKYNYVDITEDAEAMDIVTNMGYRQVPVVIADDDHWAGFRPDKISALAAASVE